MLARCSRRQSRQCVRELTLSSVNLVLWHTQRYQSFLRPINKEEVKDMCAELLLTVHILLRDKPVEIVSCMVVLHPLLLTAIVLSATYL